MSLWTNGSMSLAKIKTFIDNSLKNVTSASTDRTVPLEPEIGIRMVHSPHDMTLNVTVLGARHLPQNFGFTRVNSYVVKVKLIPELLPWKNKFETSTKNESWPQWNEDFLFPLRKEIKKTFGKSKVFEEEINGSRFIVATLYAILEDKPLIATDKKETADKDKKPSSPTRGESTKFGGKKKDDQSGSSAPSQSQEPTKKKFFGQLLGKSNDKQQEDTTASKRKNHDKRRTIGATTISLDPRTFVGKPPKPKHSGDVSTGDLWRPLKPISSGIPGAEKRRENKKGQVEVSLCMEKGEKKEDLDGPLVLFLHRLRCSMDTMEQHENLKGHLYVKMSIVDNGKVGHFWKSDRFLPCVTMKFDPDKARIIADNPYKGALNNSTFVIKLVSKNKMGKKTTVGQLVIGPEVGGTFSEQWKSALAKPGQQITKWQSFE